MLFTEAEAMMARSRSGHRRLQGRNTYLESRGPDAFAVRLHATDVVTIHRDGTYTLRTNGWFTVTTKDRINGWSPARVYSEDGTWCVWHKSDPKTPPAVKPCRACKGTGIRHTEACEPYSCRNCGGTGQRDYGSKPMPVIFSDGIRVDATGKVLDARKYDRMHDPKVAARRAKAEKRRRQLELQHARQVERERRRLLAPGRVAEFAAGHGLALTKDTVLAFKAVRDNLVSAHGARYVPGTTVTAEDYDRTLACGAGLHFSPSPREAHGYDHHATRYLACLVDRKTAIVLEDKIKAQSCLVLYEVSIEGGRLLPQVTPDEGTADPIVFGQ